MDKARWTVLSDPLVGVSAVFLFQMHAHPAIVPSNLALLLEPSWILGWLRLYLVIYCLLWRMCWASQLPPLFLLTDSRSLDIFILEAVMWCETPGASSAAASFLRSKSTICPLSPVEMLNCGLRENFMESPLTVGSFCDIVWIRWLYPSWSAGSFVWVRWKSDIVVLFFHQNAHLHSVSMCFQTESKALIGQLFIT